MFAAFRIIDCLRRYVAKMSYLVITLSAHQHRMCLDTML